jgi:hypothetical protein
MNNNYLNEEIKINMGRMIAVIVFIITQVVAILLALKSLRNAHKTGKLSFDEESRLYNLIEKFVIVLVFVYITYTNIKYINLAKKEGKETKLLERQLFAAILALIGSSIILINAYETFKTGGNNVSSAGTII